MQTRLLNPPCFSAITSDEVARIAGALQRLRMKRYVLPKLERQGGREQVMALGAGLRGALEDRDGMGKSVQPAPAALTARLRFAAYFRRATLAFDIAQVS